MLISVIIPTRERAKYLAYSVQTALAIQDENIEIIVSDNASTDDTAEVIGRLDDPRLRYIRTDRRLSMRQNFQFALDHAKGDYVIYFGDDDGILPQQFPALRAILERERPDGLSWSLPTYGWPQKDVAKKAAGVRFRKEMIFGTTEPIDARARKEATEACNLKNFTYYPRLYHGAASRAYLQRLSNSDGVFFCGSIPDIYFCYRACQVGGKFLFSYHPFSVNGYSSASTGGSHGATSGDNKLSGPAQKFNQENEKDPLSDVLPPTLSVAAVFFSTLETVSERFPKPAFKTDYTNWYGYVLRDVNHKSQAIKDQVTASLKAHAIKTGTEAELANADPETKKNKKTLADRWSQLIGNFTSLRLSAETDGDNTILSAVNMCDAVLSDSYAKVLGGEMSRAQAWAKLRKNARQFKRTL